MCCFEIVHFEISIQRQIYVNFIFFSENFRRVPLSKLSIKYKTCIGEGVRSGKLKQSETKTVNYKFSHYCTQPKKKIASHSWIQFREWSLSLPTDIEINGKAL